MGLILFLTQSCSSTRSLSTDQKALVRNHFDIQTDDKRIKKGDIKKEILTLVKQSPQKKNPLNPRTWGKPLTIYDQVLTRETAEAIEKYLRNRKGFYQARVTYGEASEGRRMAVTYIIILNERSYVGEVSYDSDDPALMSILESNIEERRVKSGDPLDAKLFELERARIINLFTEQGYANFNGNYIEFQGDSSNSNIDVTFKIYNPLEKTRHPRYKIGDINIFTEHILSQNPLVGLKDTLNGISYLAKSNRFVVEPRMISNVISLRNGNTYKKSLEAKTNRNLSRLSPYRFAVIDPYVSGDSLYNYNIFLTPRDHKWVFDMGANLFYSSISQIGRNLFGFSGNVGFTNRNYQHRAIRHNIALEGTFEFEFPSLTEVDANSISTQLNNTFDVPKVVDVFRITNVLHRLKLIDDETFNTLDQNGTTEIKFGIGLTSILDFYVLNSFNASWSYNFQPNPRLRFIVQQIGINVLDIDVKDRFQQEILANNPLLAESFTDNLFTGFLFRELSIFKQTRERDDGIRLSFIGNFELSGFENFVVNKLVNAVSSYDDNWKLGGIEFGNFFRTSADIRFYKQFSPRTTFAARFNTAIAVPYGGSDVHFVKQYFVGGPNSIRGWQLRELGPGGYSERLLNPVENQSFFQSGEFKLEFSTELRFDVFWLLEGAIFLDGGNVWLIRDDPIRPGGKISSNFMRQLALSVGYGFRLDFDYFLFRFDIGYKLRNPFPDPETGSHFVLTNGRWNGVLGNVNFAINYPF